VLVCDKVKSVIQTRCWTQPSYRPLFI